MANRMLGRIPQAKDDRDHLFMVSRRITASLPPAMNLKANMPSQQDQGGLGRCGPTTAQEMILYDQKVEYMPIEKPSAIFMYWMTRYLMGTVNQDSGVDNRTLLKAIAKYGQCSVDIWPDDNSKYQLQPSQKAMQAAVPNRIVDYAAVPVNELQCKGCIASGIPFMFGFSVFQSMMSDEVAATGLVPMPQFGESPVGGHDITAYGYDDATQLLRCRNHWINDDGSPWGEGGDALLPYSYCFNPSYASDFWVIKTIPGARPAPPTPVPVPTPVPPGPPPTPVPGTKLPSGTYILGSGAYAFVVP